MVKWVWKPKIVLIWRYSLSLQSGAQRFKVFFIREIWGPVWETFTLTLSHATYSIDQTITGHFNKEIHLSKHSALIRYYISNNNTVMDLFFQVATECSKWIEQFKNRNWQEADQLAVYKRSRGVEPRTTWNKSSSWSGCHIWSPAS